MLMTSHECESVTGLVLAGGRGTRMGGVDKGLQMLHGLPLAVHAMRRLGSQVGEIMVSANRNQATYAGFGARVVPDAIARFEGPLAGLQSGMMRCRTPYLISVPCDAPYFPLDLVQRLMAGLSHEQKKVAIAVTGPDDGLQTQPAFCLAHVSMIAHLSAFLQQSERRFAKWAVAAGAATVHFGDELAFTNVNSMETLACLEMQEAMRAGLPLL